MRSAGLKRGRVDSGLVFAEALRRHRRAEGLTQAQLAERARLSERAINDLERGLKHPQRATVRSLVEALALSPDQAERFELSARWRLPPVHPGAARSTTTCLLPSPALLGASRPSWTFSGSWIHVRTGLPARLVTLTGAGGCGKTRLALEVAWRVLDAFPDGAWFIDLSPLTDERLVPLTVSARSACAKPRPGPARSRSALGAGRRLLLVLDNCEHLIQSCAEMVSALLHGTTTVRILATSRELLRVPGEAAWRVPSLAVPESAQVLDPDKLIQFEAVRLFVNRIRLVQPEFALRRPLRCRLRNCAVDWMGFRSRSSSPRRAERVWRSRISRHDWTIASSC